MLKWPIALSLSVSLWMPATLQAQQGAATLTASDYAEIQRLNEYWVHGVDMGDRALTMRAFAPGGVLWQPAGFGGCRSSTTDCDAVQRPPEATRPRASVIPDVPYAKIPGCTVSKTPGCLRLHYVTDSLIEPTAMGAKGLSRVFITEKDPGKPPILTEDSGTYIDTYEKGPDGWGIKLKLWFPFTEKGSPYKPSAADDGSSGAAPGVPRK